MSKAVLQFVEMVRQAYHGKTKIALCDGCHQITAHRIEERDGWEYRICKRCGWQGKYRVSS